MKPGLAVLPLEVWTDVLVYPWITRRRLAQIVDRFKNRKFAEKLQFRLHDWGKQTLGCLSISSKRLKKRKHYKTQYRASLNILGRTRIKKDCGFPESEMPENIKSFTRLLIEHLDNQVLDFLHKVKPLFTNVFLEISSELDKTGPRTHLHTVLVHLLPMLAGIRGIKCTNAGFHLLEQHFPDAFAGAKELILTHDGYMMFDEAEEASIPALLDWLDEPLDFAVHGPRFLQCDAEPATINAFIKDVHEQFLAATTTSSAFVVYLLILYDHLHQHQQVEFTIQNAATNEQLTVRNAQIETNGRGTHYYVEIMRHPIGAEAKMREWIKEWAYYELQWNPREEQQMLWIDWLTIGYISDKYKALAVAMDQAEDELAAGDAKEDEAGQPSTSAAAK